MVREKGLEPSRLAALVPKTSVSTNSTTRAFILLHAYVPTIIYSKSLLALEQMYFILSCGKKLGLRRHILCELLT